MPRSSLANIERTPAEKIARIISNCTVPPIVSYLTFIFIVFSFEKQSLTIIISTTTITIFALILPIVMFFIFLRRGKISDVDALYKEERTIPYLLTIALLSVGFAILQFSGAGWVVRSMLLLYIIQLALLTIVNTKWKMSAHAMGIGGPLGIFAFLFGFYALPFFFLLCLTGWARITLKCHTLSQVVSGGVSAALLNFFLLSLLNGFYNV